MSHMTSVNRFTCPEADSWLTETTAGNVSLFHAVEFDCNKQEVMDGMEMREAGLLGFLPGGGLIEEGHATLVQCHRWVG